MSFFLPNKLNPQGQKLLTIILSLPIFVSSSYVLYKRLVLEENPRGPVTKNNDLLAQYQKDKERDFQHQQQHQQQEQYSNTSSSRNI
ncbi:hypothetical protein BCR41DRAFT_156443 [Lobosporangium transversale]|uniref:Uncharacterized protein n=1 Tax=Lobosporangium transversale TaxID=64571 RepID=A0A1Y2H0C7_9FUNG|nr:hypothetical protein BCR41DRAFT_156443 [Lobosporangium transversale]ORZ27504.1 hypothetical protein BCR41DRAFT_156443 [Lobosporangium transversale]|eukprot:XP_021885231.1 hypothetical protein BCR41DRAFT_156443 [Lobosporangium transversale]